MTERSQEEMAGWRDFESEIEALTKQIAVQQQRIQDAWELNQKYGKALAKIVSSRSDDDKYFDTSRLLKVIEVAREALGTEKRQ